MNTGTKSCQRIKFLKPTQSTMIFLSQSMTIKSYKYLSSLLSFSSSVDGEETNRLSDVKVFSLHVQ